MRELLSQLFTVMPETMTIPHHNLVHVLFSLILSAIIAIVISQIYKHTHRGMNFELNFMTSLVLLAPIVTVVMLFIRGDLVLSLGLIGSLSIIRFRTPIKDTRDMIFLLWAITVGLGAGTFNWIVVIVSTIFLTLIALVLHYIRYGRSKNTDFVLVVSGDNSLNDANLEAIVKRYTKEMRVRSHEIEGGNWEIIFELNFPRLTNQVTKELVKELETLPGIKKVSLLAPQLSLPV